MLRLVKKAAAAKNIPLLALALFAAVFFGSEALASFEVQGDQHWMYNESSGCNPTNPDCYTEAGAPLDNLCENDEEICGIVAPNDTSIPDSLPQKPLIDEELEELIETGEFVPNKVFLRPLSN